MDWLHIGKLLLIYSTTGVVLVIGILVSIFLFQVVRIAADARRIADRVEAVTDVRNWVSFIKTTNIFKRFL